MDGLGAVLSFDVDVFGFQLGEIDSGDGLAVDDEGGDGRRRGGRGGRGWIFEPSTTVSME